MTLIDEQPATTDGLESADAEALFKQAKRRERRRRLLIVGIVVLVVAAAVIAATTGGGSRPRASRGDSPGPRPRPPVSGTRPWSLTSVLETTLADNPVALQGTPFAYAITVAGTPGTSSPLGRLSRIDLATGHMALGSRLSSLSQLFTLGSSLEVLSPTNETPNGAATGPWFIRPVIGHGTLLGRAVPVPFLSSSTALAVPRGPTVGHDGVWLSSGSSVFLVNASTGMLVRSENLGGDISSISIDPTGRLLDVVLNGETRIAIDELDARTGRVIVHDTRGGGLVTAGVDAVRGGAWFSFRTGNAGGVELLRASGLKMVQPPRGSAPGQETIPTMDGEMMSGIYPVSVGPMLWLWNFASASCVGPSSGAYLAGTVFHSSGGLLSWFPFADWNGHLYATGDTGTVRTEIVSVTVPRVCR